LNDGHCSDELLIGFLDGEVQPQESRKVGAHLDRCWSCRARCREIENAITGISRLFSDADPAVADSVAHIRTPLFGAMEAPRKGKVVMRSIRPVLLFAGALAAAAAVSRWVVWLPHADAPPAIVQARPAQRRAVAAPSEVASAAPVLKPPTVALPLSAVAVPPLAVAPVDLDEVEMSLRFRLHQTGADLHDGAIRIRQAEGGVVVDGVVDDSGQLAELRQTASGIEHPEILRVNVRTAEGLPPSAASVYPASQPVVSRSQPFLQTLISLAGSERELTGRGNAAVETVESMTDTAWALRRLTERFASGPALSANSRQLLDTMESDYRARIRGLGARLRVQLDFLPGWAAGSSAACTADDDAAAQVFALRDLVEWLFAGKEMEPGPRFLEEAARSISAGLDCLDAFKAQVQGE
jgi:hypothetical protein